MEDIISRIDNIYLKGNFTYAFENYVDRSFWDLRLTELFHNCFIDNLTDFNYRKSFFYVINISGNTSTLGSQLFRDQLLQGMKVYQIHIEISILAPYLTYRFVKYSKEVEYEFKYEPFQEDHTQYQLSINKLIYNSKLIELNDESLLKTKVKILNLENADINTTIYDCLFEDNYK